MYGLRIYGNQNYVDNSVLDDLPEKSNFVNHEPIQEFHRMERVWGLHRNWGQAWDRNQQDPPVFLSMLPYLRWVRLLSFTWCLLSGEISGNIYGQRREIHGTIYNSFV